MLLLVTSEEWKSVVERCELALMLLYGPAAQGLSQSAVERHELAPRLLCGPAAQGLSQSIASKKLPVTGCLRDTHFSYVNAVL